MTEIQWFAFVILPAIIAVTVIFGVRVFERFNPVPVPDRKAEQPADATRAPRPRQH